MSHSPASRQLTWSATPAWRGTPSPRRKSGAYRLRSRSGKHMASVGLGCARASWLVLESGLGWIGLGWVGLAPGRPSKRYKGSGVPTAGRCKVIPTSAPLSSRASESVPGPPTNHIEKDIRGGAEVPVGWTQGARIEGIYSVRSIVICADDGN
ncbi:uncharacterized protein EAE98_008325 [Botrytis deweyae]|uniref:Uncharacterized protein n=1 Tax=Botrytis deweyae TaxID=2478750 RepID=A0ABQ7IFE7_9HELO|nr:uncharacterized protein EAE98_008325 [Botrytis deweyae]KAF7922114.1 hypothetical protein EAE98_008325 [Botrytis deweyae]